MPICLLKYSVVTWEPWTLHFVVDFVCGGSDDCEECSFSLGHIWIVVRQQSHNNKREIYVLAFGNI